MPAKWSGFTDREMLDFVEELAVQYYTTELSDAERRATMLEIAKAQAVLKERGLTWTMPEKNGKVAESG